MSDPIGLYKHHHGVRGVSAETHVGSDAKCGLCVSLHDEVILILFD